MCWKSLVEKSVDLPATMPSFPRNLKWVGIKGLKCYVYFKPIFETDSNPKALLCNIDIYTSLSRDRRGVHLSRLSQELINLSEKKIWDIAVFCKELADNVRKSQKQQCSKINLKTDYVIKNTTSLTSKNTLVPLQIGMRVITSGDHTYYQSILSSKTIVVCPCGIEMFKTVLKHNANRNSSNSHFPSHSQRATIKLSVTSSIPVAHKELFEIIASVTPILGTTLKRPDEFDLLNNVFNNPMFCEDLVRVTLEKADKYFKNKDISRIDVTVLSDESIHPYSVFTQGDIRGGKEHLGNKFEDIVEEDAP